MRSNKANKTLDCLILARGGSKGVPNKNIRKVGGKPLIGYPIEAAMRSTRIRNVYVSTNSPEIAVTAQGFGAIIITRPEAISGDWSTDKEAFEHFVEHTGFTEPLVHLRATTPLIEPDTLDEAIQKFFQFDVGENCTSLRSAHQLGETAFKMFTSSGEFWRGLFPELAKTDPEYYNKPRQFYPDTYAPNGYVDIVKPSVFMDKVNPSFHGNKILSFITPHVIEVDTPEDLERLEFEVQRRTAKDTK
jgi:CMP-N-acetylneuraminic acid synthetase